MTKLARCRLLLLLAIPLFAHASYSPGQLIVRLRIAPVRALDGAVTTTGISSIDELIQEDQTTAAATVTTTVSAFAFFSFFSFVNNDFTTSNFCSV